MHFSELSLAQPILQGIEQIGFETATPVQEKVIPEVLRRNDVLASAQTGTGKTGAFVIPLLNLLNKQRTAGSSKHIPTVLIISPTRELAVQIEENCRAFSEFTSISSCVVYGGTSMDKQIITLKKGVDIVVATPGRLLDLRKQGYIDLNLIEILVLDEADLMLDMGFIDEVQKIIRLSENLQQRLLFSATISPKVADLAKSFLIDPERIEIGENSSVAIGVRQKLYYVPKPDKIELLLNLMRNMIKDNSILIFRRTKFGVEKAQQSLLKNGFPAESLHGDKNQAERNEALQKFKKSEARILVATDVAARGLDIEGLDYVLNFDIPNVPEVYVHRIGRTGRAGKIGKSISFCSADERSYIKAIEKLIGEQISIEDDNPFPLDKNAEAPVHKKKGSKHKKGRKGKGSKANKKRWY